MVFVCELLTERPGCRDNLRNSKKKRVLALSSSSYSNKFQVFFKKEKDLAMNKVGGKQAQAQTQKFTDSG